MCGHKLVKGSRIAEYSSIILVWNIKLKLTSLPYLPEIMSLPDLPSSHLPLNFPPLILLMTPKGIQIRSSCHANVLFFFRILFPFYCSNNCCLEMIESDYNILLNSQSTRS